MTANELSARNWLTDSVDSPASRNSAATFSSARSFLGYHQAMAFRPEDQLVLELFVRDFDASMAFYRSLGFEVERTEDDFAVLRWEGCEFLLQMSRPLGERPTHPAGNVRMLVGDVDEHWETARRLGAPVFMPIGDRHYGLRDFTVLDPDGFGLRFAQPLTPRV
jgi:catechol 2,3-dioxygenase-like lactoylglutathione lyase family enzyme